MYFKVQVTALRPRLHRNWGFPLNWSRKITNPYKFPQELNRPASLSLGTVTRTIELTSSLEAATSITSQMQEIGDLFFITKFTHNPITMLESMKLFEIVWWEKLVEMWRRAQAKTKIWTIWLNMKIFWEKGFWSQKLALGYSKIIVGFFYSLTIYRVWKQKGKTKYDCWG